MLYYNQHLWCTINPHNHLLSIDNGHQEYQSRCLHNYLMQNFNHSLSETYPRQSSEIHEIFLSKLLNLPLNEGKIQLSQSQKMKQDQALLQYSDEFLFQYLLVLLSIRLQNRNDSRQKARDSRQSFALPYPHSHLRHNLLFLSQTANRLQQ